MRRSLKWALANTALTILLIYGSGFNFLTGISVTITLATWFVWFIENQTSA
jgi:hypothetical protein